MKAGEGPGEKEAAERRERDPAWHDGVSKHRLQGTGGGHSLVLQDDLSSEANRAVLSSFLSSLTVDGRHTLCQGKMAGSAGTSSLEQVVQSDPQGNDIGQ